MSTTNDNTKKATISRTRLTTIIIIVAVIIIGSALAIIESNMDGKIIVSNGSAKNIERLAVYFERPDGYDTPYVIEQGIKSGEEINLPYAPVDLTAGDCIICFEVTFEGEKPVWMYDGIFSTVFNGRIAIDFYDEDGENCMHAKAGVGLFQSTTQTDVDTDFYIYPDKEDWNYKYK